MLKGAVVLANPWNLDVGNSMLQSTFIGRELYSATMGRNMKALVKKHEAMISENPRFDMENLQRCRYLHQFDRAIQCPAWGYPTEGAYYRDASSIDSLAAIRIPFFAINAIDDPVSLLISYIKCY